MWWGQTAEHHSATVSGPSSCTIDRSFGSEDLVDEGDEGKGSYRDQNVAIDLMKVRC
jgi:hypothetical protein